MGFHKRYITKDLILSNIDDLDSLFNADALITDMWSSRFIDDLDPKERKIRKEILEKYKFSSSLNLEKEPLFNQLHSMSECLISLFNNPSWFDVSIASKKIGLSTKNSGEFDKLKEESIERIIDYYNKPNRNDKIEEILK